MDTAIREPEGKKGLCIMYGSGVLNARESNYVEGRVKADKQRRTLEGGQRKADKGRRTREGGQRKADTARRTSEGGQETWSLRREN